MLSDLQRRVLEVLAGEPGGVTTGSLLGRLDVADEELFPALESLTKSGLVVAWVASLSGGWKITPRGHAAVRT